MKQLLRRLQAINRDMAIIDYESDKAAWLEEGRVLGLAEYRTQRHIESLLSSVRSLMKKKGWSSDDAIDALAISPEDRAIISARL